jgi:elongation factor P
VRCARVSDGKARAMQVSTAEFKKGLRIVFDGNPYTIVDFQHVKPGKGGAFVRTKLKHMKLGRVIDNTFRSGERVELVDFEEKRMQFLYRDERYHFMDTETYEQVSLSENEMGDAREYLKENMEVEVLFIDGAPAALELPNFVELAIVKTDPGVRGDTAQGGTKPATLETGAVVQVPLFLSEGDVVKVDTRTGEYLGRVAAAG